MNQPNKTAIGEKVALDKIEATFQQHWRAAVDESSSEAVLKASTINLIVLFDDEKKFAEMLADIHQVISHHPGRLIVALLDRNSQAEAIEAHISAFPRTSKEGQTQISAELVTLQTGEPGAVHLAGTILPLLLADLPVYFWCTSMPALTNPHFKILFQFTDRLIVATPRQFNTSAEMSEVFRNIVALGVECKISDLSWAQLTAWREAVAQFFDVEKNQKYLAMLDEIEIVHSGDGLSSHAFLMAGWLASSLRSVGSGPAIDKAETIFFRRRSEQLSIKIRKKEIADVSGLFKIKLIAEENEQAVIFTATAMPDGAIQTTVQHGGRLFAPNFVLARHKTTIELLCNELDYLQQDTVYLNASASVHEYLHEG